MPVEQIGRVSRYSGGESPPLSKLGGTEWLRTKQRVRKAVGDLAEELLALYASASVGAAATPYPADTPWQAEMEAAFPYEETRRPAARGDRGQGTTWRPAGRWTGSSSATSGYGKTEVAIRAAFKATQDGKQVAVLVPTTVLAAQHFTDVLAAVRGRSR